MKDKTAKGSQGELERRIEALEYDLMKYKLTSDALGIAHWDMDVAGGDPVNPDNVFSWSQEFRHMLGFSSENDFPNVLHSWSDRLHPDDYDRVIAAFTAHLNDHTGKTPYDLEYRLKHKNGRYRHFHAFGTTLRDSEGVPLRVAGALNDITKEKLMQDRITEESAKTEALAHWYESILDAIPLPVTVTDADMKWTFVNKAVEDFLGTKREDMMGKLCSNWGSHVCNTPDCGIVCAKNGLKHTYFNHKDSSYQVDVEILRDVDGGTAGFIEVVQDITQVQTLAREKAEAESRAKSAFLATMSHEMRTPLNAIIGMTEIGKRSGDPEVKDYALHKIEDSSAHLLGVISDILDMSKIEADKLELSPVEYDFERMLQKVFAMINFRIEEKRQKFSVNMDSHVPLFVINDDQRLAQVVMNLLSNAVKFTRAGGKISLDISLIAEEDGLCELQFVVADSGIGISRDQQSNLFNAFTQAEKGISREFGGTGLGLVISRRIVELMGGSMRVESEPGKGSRFTFTVKLQRGTKNFRSALDPDVQWDKVRVLIVDDSELTCKYLKESFDRLGLHCETVLDGISACHIIEERGDFDIYFIDWIMPDMDGTQLIKWMKSHQKHGVVIMITAAEWEDARAAAAKSGADRCLQKPILSSAIIDCINECLGSARENEKCGKNNEFSGKRILLAEDVDINREILITLLNGTGLVIDEAMNGREALDMISAAPGRYDLIFMDMQMPVMDGLETTRQIRALPDLHCAKIPIIAMTANVFKDDIDKCVEAGMNDHIGKPMDMNTVLEKLRMYLWHNHQTDR